MITIISRITKCFELDSGDFIAACDHFKNVCSRANNNYHDVEFTEKEGRKVIIYETSNDDIGINFSLLKFNDITKIHTVCNNDETAAEIHEHIIIFLKQLVKVQPSLSRIIITINSYHHQEMASMKALPFNMSLIIERLKNIK